MSADLVKKEETTPTFTYLNKDTGLLETRHKITGELIAIQSTPDPLAIKKEKAIMVKIDGREILVEPGVSTDKVEVSAASRPHRWVYSTMMGEIVAQRLAEGETLTAICKDPGMPPYSVINRWRHENSSFKEMISLAFKARAEYHRDRAIDVAESHENDEDVAGAKLLVDTHKWAAGTDHSERFGNKTKVDVDVKPIVHFIVDTGIRRPEDPGYNKDQTKLVQDLTKDKMIERSVEALPDVSEKPSDS